MTFWRTAALVVAIASSGLALAAALRYGLIEPADATFRCDGGGQDAWCVLRAWTIQTFVHQRIGWGALVMACAATLLQWRWVAGLALLFASAGLVLYTTELCAPAALLALLVFVRDGKPATPASTSTNAQ
jgi:hypothetical protein